MIVRFSFASSSWYLSLLVVLALFHICLSNPKFDDVLCKEEERQALLQFKQGLIDEANRLASWIDDDSDCCTWAGIVCGNLTGHVHGIHLRGADGHCRSHQDPAYVREYKDTSNQRLKGNLSSSLLHLKQLRHLDLSCNDFGGIQVPSFIGSLENLRYLNLSSSNFLGIIPPQLGNLSELYVLSLGSSYFPSELTRTTNMQWLTSLHMLHHLDMSGVDLREATDWFQVINSLPFLDHLHLSSCRLSNIHPYVPRLNITSLSLLDLSRNFFNSLVPRWIFSTNSLVSLLLTRCRFYGPIPSTGDSFRNLTSLKFLHVSENSFMNSALVLKGLSSVGSNLISLHISSCGVSSLVIDSLHNLTSLLSLDLSDNQLTKMIPKSLGNLCNLRKIDLSGSHFRKFTLTYLLESFFKCKSPRLESLMLEAVSLSGHLPDQFDQLIHLEDLRLQYNNIIGTIPDSIGQLSSMKTLKLFKNQISGPIPYSIGQLSLLEVFDLYHNNVNGSLPDSIGRLSSLEVLDLSYNHLTGSLPASMGQLSNLNHLDIQYNNLSGVLTEAHFARLRSLLNLNGRGNKLILRPHVADWNPPFIKIRQLFLKYWNLGPRFPLWLQFLKELYVMDISNTNISAPLPESFWRSFPRLVDLDMSQNHIQGTLVGILPIFNFLDLSFNEFTGQLPNLTDSPVLAFLDLSNNFFVGSLDHLLCSKGSNELDVLSLGNNYFSGVIPDCWENSQWLRFLNLENNNLSGGIPTTLGFLSRLESLNMHGNKLSGKLHHSLMNLTKLRVLQLGGNKLVGSIPKWFGKKLPSLKILNLRSNNFEGNIPHELCYLTYIQILDLAHNNLSGNIPRCFNRFNVLSGKKPLWLDPFAFSQQSDGKELNSDSLVIKGRGDTYRSILSLVMILDLSVNNFVGHIPSELTSLKALQSLNLSQNQLSGTIPEKIGDLKSLESFDVSLNSLSGELPMSLSSLNFLSVFNVSYNNLIGRIPTSTQLQGFDKSSFFGNKLCGAPLSNRCVGVEVPRANQEEEDDGHDWGFIISMLLGFVVSFWMVVAPLMVSISWRIAYFRLLNELGYKVYDLMHKYVLLCHVP